MRKKPSNLALIATSLGIGAGASSCVSLTSQERAVLKEAEACGISSDEQKVKNPALAGALNILPGVGNFYLANRNGPQIAYGVLNLLVWPYSVLWGVPQAAIDANTLNKKETAQFYLYGTGKERLDALKKERGY